MLPLYIKVEGVGTDTCTYQSEVVVGTTKPGAIDSPNEGNRPIDHLKVTNDVRRANAQQLTRTEKNNYIKLAVTYTHRK